MTIAEGCVFAALLLCLSILGPAKFGPGSAYDNADPRDPGAYRDPARARALGAHKNGLETFPFFLGAVLLAEFRGAPRTIIDALAIGFLLLRIAYTAAYLGNRPTLRSSLWTLGFVMNTAIFFLPAIYR